MNGSPRLSGPSREKLCTISGNRKKQPGPMLEILNHPAFYPALFGFLGGLVLVWLIFSVRLRFARAAARATEKASSEKLANLASQKSALETEVATLRVNEARLIKYQGELEGRTKSDEQRTRDFASLVKAMQENLGTALEAREKVLLEAISRLSIAPPVAPVVAPEPTPASIEDLDFVPLENLPGEGAEPEEEEEDTSFQGFDLDQTAAKAESAANAFREALKKNMP